MRTLELWKIKGRIPTNQNCPIQSRFRIAPAFLRSLLILSSLCFLHSTASAVVVNVQLLGENPIQNISGDEVPVGTALFIVSYKTDQNAFFTALRDANSAASLVSVFQNQLQFFNLNNTPTVKGTFTQPDPEDNSTFRGWDTGNPIVEVSTSSTPLLPIFALFSSSTNPFEPSASFLLVKTRGTDASYSIPTDTTNTDIEISASITAGSDVIFGQFFSSGAFQMATAGAYGLVTSDPTLTMNTGSLLTYQILSNNGANSFGVTSLPTWASLNSVTGVITLSPGSGDTGTFTLSLSATNTITGKTATGSLIVTVQAATGPSFTSIATATATVGVDMSYPITTDAPSTFTAITALPSGLTLNSVTGVLSGIPRSATTSTITIRAARTANAASFTDQNLVLTVSNLTLEISALVSGQLTRTAGTAHTIPVTIPAGFTVDSYTIETAATGVTYSAGNLRISSTAAPFEKGKTSEAVSLTLKRTSGLGGSTISISKDFNLRLVAPAPTSLSTAGPFEVNVGEDYSLQLLTDVSTICPNQNISIAGTLPPGLINTRLAGRDTGLISGKNTSTTLPYEFAVNVVAETSTKYEGGGTLTVPVIFRLRNPVAPVITSETSRIAGVGKVIAQYSIQASGAPSRFAAVGLPSGLVLNGQNITGTPTQAGNYDVRLEAYNSFRPGSTLTTDLQSGTATLRIFVSASKPPVAVPLSGAHNLQVGNAASFSMLSAQELGLRISGYGFPPGLSINSSTGMVTGTPTTAGTYSVTIFVQNGKGWIKKAVSLTVR